LTRRKTKARYRADARNARKLASWIVEMDTLAFAAEGRVMGLVPQEVYHDLCQHQPIETWDRLQYWLELEKGCSSEAVTAN